MSLEIIPVPIPNDIKPNDSISDIIIDSFHIEENDIVVIAQKIISKSEGRLVKLDSVKISLLAEGLASAYQKDPRLMEVILNESKRIIRLENGIIIVETNHGIICANAGVDESNVPLGYATLLPVNPDKSANDIRNQIKTRTGKNTAVIISDTFGRPFRMGQINQAIGVSGIAPILGYKGKKDTFQRELRVTEIAIADELCSASELVTGKTKNIPVCIIRNFVYDNCNENTMKLVRTKNEDLFR